MALVWVSKPYTRQQGVTIAGHGAETKVCPWWAFPLADWERSPRAPRHEAWRYPKHPVKQSGGHPGGQSP